MRRRVVIVYIQQDDEQHPANRKSYEEHAPETESWNFQYLPNLLLLIVCFKQETIIIQWIPNSWGHYVNITRAVPRIPMSRLLKSIDFMTIPLIEIYDEPIFAILWI